MYYTLYMAVCSAAISPLAIGSPRNYNLAQDSIMYYMYTASVRY